MSAKHNKELMIHYWTTKCVDLLKVRNNLQRDDLEYVVEKIANLKDERLKECITTLIGWGDEERYELETFCAIALELMKDATPSRIREAARRVELKYLMRMPND